MNSSMAAARKPESGKRTYRRQDPERRRAERKWIEAARKREHARRPGQGHGVSGERIDRKER
jgi:hypothetical protein